MSKQLTPKEQAEELWKRINDLLPPNDAIGMEHFIEVEKKIN